jgi:hypothetical protein
MQLKTRLALMVLSESGQLMSIPVNLKIQMPVALKCMLLLTFLT